MKTAFMMRIPIQQVLLRIRAIFSELTPRNYPQCDYLLVCHDNDRGYAYEGLAYSQLLDTLRDNLLKCHYTVATIAAPFSCLNEDKAVGSPISINGLYARSQAASLIFSLLPKLDRLYNTKRQVNLWLHLLSKMQPSVVIGIQPSEGLCAAGKELGTPIIDLQHGVIEHSKDPSKYYSCRSNSVIGKNGTPSSVICWDRGSANVIETMWPGTSTMIAGNPWLSRFLTADPQDNLVTNEINLIKSKLRTASVNKIVLLTTQWVPTFDRIEIPSNIREAILLSISKGVQWGIKFHPVEIKRLKTEALAKYAINALGQEVWESMIDLSSHALPAILAFTAYHVTGSSASTYEASFFGIKTGLWEHTPEVATWFSEQIQHNQAEFLSSDPRIISNRIMHELSIRASF
jgi:hypothetical protein